MAIRSSELTSSLMTPGENLFNPKSGALTDHGLLWLKRLFFLGACAPALLMLVGGIRGQLGAEPVDAVTRVTGIWTLNFLMMTLAVAPLRYYLGWFWPLRLRRMLGLFTFFYASLHLATYVVFEQFFDVAEIVKDILKRPYITAGMLAFGILFLLAMTSTNRMIRHLGKHWKPLHRLVYVAGIAGVLHFFWLVKRDVTEPGIYVIVLCVLLCSRLLKPRRRKSAHSS